MARALQRNVRPKRAEAEDDILLDDEQLGGSPGEPDTASDEELSEDEDGSKGEFEPEDHEAGDDAERQIANVSFGALKQAQDTLSRKRKRGSETNDDRNEKLEALRERLREIKAKKAGDKEGGIDNRDPAARMRDGRPNVKVTQDDKNEDNDQDESDSDSAPSEEGAPSRSSKHAPGSQSTRHQVTRKRTVIDVPKRHFRDPRFDALSQHPSNHTAHGSEKAYSFLTDYQKSEIADLKAAMKHPKTSEEDRLVLRRKINSMENRLKAKEAKEREQEVLRRHRKEERGKVEQGKTPYYLKQKEIKERTLVEKFKGMKGKEREKVMEKRRLKESQRERRMMPRDRRQAG